MADIAHLEAGPSAVEASKMLARGQDKAALFLQQAGHQVIVTPPDDQKHPPQNRPTTASHPPLRLLPAVS
ncbi:hypothetical protein BM221_010597 [Beauveria bassiana]|uniref:Uncharacterized protein n=1 Tax=Beauveria bassiana TaxID=176275 RepID=A0A2N6N891_BEABA|nr:hypothetical protein BM221_010597 [Beauveria bassiana]